MNKLEQRIALLEDIENIKQLTHQYAHYINQGWGNESVEAENINTIFTEDAIWESSDMNIKVIGLTAIKECLLKETKPLQFVMHTYLNPTIEIKENNAFGKWLFWVISKPNLTQMNQVYMSQNIMYKKTIDGWRIQNLQLFFGTILKK